LKNGELTLRVTRKQIAKIVFLIVVLASTILFAYNTAKFVGFYSALTNFEMRLIEIYFVSSPEELNVTIKLRISNPTSYADLKLSDIVGTTYYEGENHTVTISAGGPRSASGFQQIVTPWWLLPESRIFIDRSLPPHSITYVSMNLSAKGDDAKVFNAYFEKQGSQQEDIRWQLSLRATIHIPIFIKEMDLQYEFTW
jgi:hypothetical protein